MSDITDPSCLIFADDFNYSTAGGYSIGTAWSGSSPTGPIVASIAEGNLLLQASSQIGMQLGQIPAGPNNYRFPFTFTVIVTTRAIVGTPSPTISIQLIGIGVVFSFDPSTDSGNWHAFVNGVDAGAIGTILSYNTYKLIAVSCDGYNISLSCNNATPVTAPYPTGPITGIGIYPTNCELYIDFVSLKVTGIDR